MSEEKEVWIVCGDREYYPWILRFKSKKRAEKEFEEAEPFEEETVFLAKVVKHKGKEQP